MNDKSTVAALREIAGDLESRAIGELARDQEMIEGAALRLRDIATTLERQGGALDLAALAERLEAAAQAINAAAERLEALTQAPPDLDVAGFGEAFTTAVRRILTEDYQEIIARGDRPERVAAVARAVPVADVETVASWAGESAPIVSRTTERHTVHADGSETHEHYVDDGSDQAVHFAATDMIGERLAKAGIPTTTETIAAFLEGHAFQRAMEVPTIKIAPDVYDNLGREHAATLRGEHDAPPPVITSRAVTWPDPMAGSDDVPPRWSPLGAAALAVPVPPAPSALQALADSRRPFSGEDLGVGPGGFVMTHLGPPLPTVTLSGEWALGNASSTGDQRFMTQGPASVTVLHGYAVLVDGPLTATPGGAWSVRGTAGHPCEHCGQSTDGSTRDARGFMRCNACGYPGQ